MLLLLLLLCCCCCCCMLLLLLCCCLLLLLLLFYKIPKTIAHTHTPLMVYHTNISCAEELQSKTEKGQSGIARSNKEHIQPNSKHEHFKKCTKIPTMKTPEQQFPLHTKHTIRKPAPQPWLPNRHTRLSPSRSSRCMLRVFGKLAKHACKIVYILSLTACNFVQLRSASLLCFVLRLLCSCRHSGPFRFTCLVTVTFLVHTRNVCMVSTGNKNKQTNKQNNSKLAALENYISPALRVRTSQEVRTRSSVCFLLSYCC